MGAATAEMTARGCLETMTGLGVFGGPGIPIPARQDAIAAGGGINPADIIGQPDLEPSAEQLQEFDAQENEARRREEEAAELRPQQSMNAFRPFNYATPPLFEVSVRLISADPFRLRWQYSTRIEWDCLNSPSLSSLPTIEQFFLWPAPSHP